MTEPALGLQSAIRSQLVSTSSVTALVPAASIMDMNQRPDAMPVIIIGEAQDLSETDLARVNHEVHMDVHVWQSEPGTVFVKQAVGAIRDALADTLWSIEGLAVADLYIASTRYMRDPDTIHSHAVVTLRARVEVLNV